MGLISGGIDVLMGVDNDPVSLSTYYYNLGSDDCRWIGEKPPKGTFPEGNHEGSVRRTVEAVMCTDIRDLHGWDIFETLDIDHIDVVVGSPPCQGFSRMGKKEVGDPRDLLLFEFARLVQEIQPEMVLMENVPGVLSKELPSGVKVWDVYLKLINEPYHGPTAASVLGLEDYRYTRGYDRSPGGMITGRNARL